MFLNLLQRGFTLILSILPVLFLTSWNGCRGCGGSDDGGTTEGECVNILASLDLTTLRGTILTPQEVIQDGDILFSREDGTILCVSEDCGEEWKGEEVTRICTDGIILPGLIDSHNHMQYNTLPRWRHDELYGNRYEWQSDSGYYDFKEAYDDISGDYICEMGKWAEIRALLSGTTSVLGSYAPYGNRCLETLIRNLDEDESASGLPLVEIYYTSKDVFDFGEEDLASVREDLLSGSLTAFVPHVSEGVDGSVRDELLYLEEMGVLMDGTAIVHGTDLTLYELAILKRSGAKIILAVRSNIDLYGETGAIPLMKTLGIDMAISPDWTPSGSMNLLSELRCVTGVQEKNLDSPFSEKELVEMVTQRAAKVLNLDSYIGSLVPGMEADITVIRGERESPYSSVVSANSDDVSLTVVDGKPLYGDQEFAPFFASSFCEEFDLCGTTKFICVRTEEVSDHLLDETMEEIEGILEEALNLAEMENPGYDPQDEEGLYQYDLYPLFSCEDDTDVACVMGDIVSGDGDGDGISDPSDNCPVVYNPAQADYDGDGEGDHCDPCPLAPDMEECEHSIEDLDGDGIYDDDDNCPFLYNPSQIDSDGDEKGDECDLCPDFPDSFDSPCPFNISELRDPSSPGHPPEGSRVQVEGVITAVRIRGGTFYGFFLQDPESVEYGGIYVFTGGDDPGVDRGERVSVKGYYYEYYGLSEVIEPEVEVMGFTGELDPIAVAPEDVTTGGPLSEPLESMLARVNDVEVIDSNPDYPDDYDEFLVTGDLRVDDYLYEDLVDNPPVGTRFPFLGGVLIYTYGDSKLAPRDGDDLEILY